MDNSGEQLFKARTMGLNPAILSAEELVRRIKDSSDLLEHKNDIESIHFYGAGCGTENPRLMLKGILLDLFPNAKVKVDEDTLAAVRATVGENSGVVCILGTGSNCSYYDGERLHQRVVSLGYSIMDDASGNWFGRQLLRDYYFKRSPEEFREAFGKAFNVDADYIKEQLYKSEHPNAYLASHASFIFEHVDTKYIKKLMRKGFKLFSKNMILQFKDVLDSEKVYFAGSIAYFGKEQLHAVADEMGFEIGGITRRPIEGLMAYHQNLLRGNSLAWD